MAELVDQYNCLVEQNKRNFYRDNFDYRRFGTSKLQIWLKDLLQPIRYQLMSRGLFRRDRAVVPNLGSLSFLYQLLQDRESRETLVNVLAYRALGHRKVKLPLSDAEYWQIFDELDDLLAQGEKLDLGSGWYGNLFSLTKYGYPINIYTTSGIVHAIFLLQQYRCQTADKIVEAKVGDVVIDAGGCWGDTALYFASKVGPGGSVYAFEFMPENLEVFKKNIQLNPDLAERITLLELAVWSGSDDSLYIRGSGPSARVSPQGASSDHHVGTLSIDDLVSGRNLPSVDLIKMDIEGAELSALHGAEETIRRFQPDLAISIYHRLSDFWEIPRWINGLGLNYHFYLRHFTIHQEETVLFASAR